MYFGKASFKIKNKKKVVEYHPGILLRNKGSNPQVDILYISDFPFYKGYLIRLRGYVYLSTYVNICMDYGGRC